MKTLLLCLGLTSLLGLATVAAQKDDLYRAARQDLDAGRWAEAAAKFGQVAERGGPDADAGLYWKAYAQEKGGRDKDALSSLRQLAAAHPKSEWLDDAKALELEIQGTEDASELPEDAELKLYALSGLVSSGSPSAVPRVLEFLRGPNPPKLKEQAVFLLTQSDAPEARKALVEIAGGQASPELRRHALEAIGSVGDPEDIDFLTRTARQEKNPELRRQALGALGMTESPKASEALRALYAESADREDREAILNALTAQENAGVLIALFRVEKDRELRKRIVEAISQMDSEEAQRFIDKMFEQ
jgi:HEAT repeat protein